MKPLQLMYVMLGLTGLARGALWLHTDLSGTEHFGLLALLPKPLPALLWILPALLCLLSLSVSNLSFAFAALLLPRLVDKVTVMGSENVRG